jgi:hypothetical protein
LLLLLEIVALLCHLSLDSSHDQGAEVSAKNNNGETPLDVAKGKSIEIWKAFEEGTKNGEAFKVLSNSYPVVRHIRDTLGMQWIRCFIT